LSAPEFKERSRILDRKAQEDATAVRELIDNEHISDRIIGFHAQQAVEKYLKSVIAGRGETYLPRHDIDYLLDVLEETSGDRIPIERDLLTALTVYAVPLRYEELADTEPLDRAATEQLVSDVAAWAQAQLRSARVK
jgi:HEPN domain-containing protein